MSGYFLTLFFLTVLCFAGRKILRLEIFSKSTWLYFLTRLIIIFVIPGFIIDTIAGWTKWYVFPTTTTYLWRTPFGFPVEEGLFFLITPIFIICLWKACRKLF